jgi:RNA polymerase sigma-70 factor (ECF subfamily)
MATTPLTVPTPRTDLAGYSDRALVEMARGHDEAAIRTLIRRHNQRLFRVARAIVHNDAEAEDVVQASYVKAFTHLATFRGEAELTTWLTRIAVNEATERLRRRRPTTGVEQIDIEREGSAQIIQFPSVQPQLDPETEMSRQEIRDFLEQAVDTLPATFRAVFVLRDVEGLSVEETASTLDIKPETVRTRLHRARRLMRSAIEAELNGAFTSLFPFDGQRCIHMADRVLLELRTHNGLPGPAVTGHE